MTTKDLRLWNMGIDLGTSLMLKKGYHHGHRWQSTAKAWWSKQNTPLCKCKGIIFGCISCVSKNLQITWHVKCMCWWTNAGIELEEFAPSKFLSINWTRGIKVAKGYGFRVQRHSCTLEEVFLIEGSNCTFELLSKVFNPKFYWRGMDKKPMKVLRHFPIIP